MSMTAQDHTGSRWITAFDETARTLLGKDAQELNDLRESVRISIK